MVRERLAAVIDRLGKFAADAAYKHLGTVSRDERTLDKIGVELTLTFDEAPVKILVGETELETKVRVKEQDNAGELYFDRTAGRFVETAMDQDMVIETTFHDSKLELSAKGKTVVKISPVEE